MSTETKPRTFWEGRSALVIPGILLVLALFLVLGIEDIETSDDALFGPKAFPWIVVGALVLTAVLLTISIWRNPELPEDEAVAEEAEPGGSDMVKSGEAPAVAPAAAPKGPASNWTAVGITVGSLILFALILQPVGWIISAGLVFAGVAIGLGSRKYLVAICAGLAMSSAMQLIFSGVLGLSLPAGIFGLG